MELTHLGGVLTGVLTATTIIIGGLLGLQRGTMSSIKTRADEATKAAEALRARLGDVVQELAEEKIERAEAEKTLRAEQTAQASRLAEVQAENEMLHQLNSQIVDWTALTDLLTHHHSEAEAHWADLDVSVVSIKTGLAEIGTSLRAILTALQRRAPDESTST